MYQAAVESSKTEITCETGCSVKLPGDVRMPKAPTNGWDAFKFVFGTVASTAQGAMPWYFGAEVLKAGFDAAGKNVSTVNTTTGSYNTETQALTDSYNTSTATTSHADSYNTSTATTSYADSYNTSTATTSHADSYNTSTATTSYADSYNDSTADPTVVQIPTQVLEPVVVQP